ncbi:MAG: MFS transporter [Alphaproteobacteria bacterium]|nr:MFS transporter [Alphaproteobacteria bacterium]
MSGEAQEAGAAWRPWAAWALGSLFFCYGFFHRVSPSVMVEDLMRDFAVGGAILGNLSAFYFYAYASLQIPVGLLLDRHGPRRLLTGAALLCAGGSLVFALAPGLGTAYLGRLLIGIGAGFTWVGALTLVTLFFPARRFALLVGLAQLIGMLGAVFGQAPMAAAVHAYGWRATLVAATLGGVVLALAMWIVVRDKPRAARGASMPTGMLQGLLRVGANPQTWYCALLGGAMTAPVLSFAGLWGVPYLVSVYGVPRPDAALVASLGFLGFGIGAVIHGYWSDRMGRRKPPLVLGSATLLVSLLTMFLGGLPDLRWFGAFSFLQGLGAGCMVVAFAAAREHNPVNATGAAYGLVNTFVVASGALFQPLIGWLLDQRWSGTMLDGARVYSPDTYTFALSSLLVMSVIGLVMALLVRETHCRQQISPGS